MSTQEKILRKLLDDIAKEQNYKNPSISVKPISTGGANYSSVLFLATISELSHEDLKLFAKVVVVGEKMRAQMDLLIFNLERFTYKDLLTKYEELQNKHGIPIKEKLRTPKFYGSNPKEYEETIVLEDLSAKGFITYDRMKSIDWDYASKSVESLARFHALSLAYSQEEPEEYKKIIDTIKFQEETFINVVGQVYESNKKTALAVTSEKNKSRFEKFLNDIDVKKLVSYYKPHGHNIQIICHGDYRPSNLMHRVEEDGTIKVVPVDFQTIYAGPPLTDLMYFIFTGSDEQFRRRHFWDLIDYYYRELCSALTNLGIDPHKFYPKDDFDKDVKKFIPYGFMIAIFLLPIVTVNTEEAPSLADDNDMVSFMSMSTSSLYPDRVNGMINDFIRWGYID